MTDSQRGQVAAAAASVYEAFFVPALFQQWADRLTSAAGVRPGHRVLDVATGTGVLARTVQEVVGPTGSVVGLDPNEAMLKVAREANPEVEWRAGMAENLPFPGAAFDAVVSQFGLMFFDDRPTALREMHRVLKAGGRLAIAVWASIDESPGYAALAALLADLFGEEAAEALRAPFALGDGASLAGLLKEAGLGDAKVWREDGVVTFPSMRSWMFTEIRGWTLADSLDDDAFERLLVEADARLPQFKQPDETVRFPITALVATASS